MTELQIDSELVRWAIGGVAAVESEALAALASGRPLLLLMHGYGSFEGDLIGLAPRLPGEFVCASPRAPLVAPPPVVGGYSWWPLNFGADGPVIPEPEPQQLVGTGPHLAALAMLRWIDELDARVRVAASSGPSAGVGLSGVALLGFSQGGCMVTSLLRLRPDAFRCGVNASGFVAPGAYEGDAALAATRPPLFWGRDEGDPIVGGERVALTTQWAPAHTQLEARLYPGIEHSISVEELGDIAEFLQRTGL